MTINAFLLTPHNRSSNNSVNSKKKIIERQMTIMKPDKNVGIYFILKLQKKSPMKTQRGFQY
jgi:hypothetical protein